MSFINECFNSNGDIKELEYPKSVSKWNCMFCPYKEDKENCGEGIHFTIIPIYVYKINVTKIKIMSAKKDMTLTSVKVKSDLFENFKIECVKRKFSFQKLADRALFLYLTDEDFRKSINNQTNLEL